AAQHQRFVDFSAGAAELECSAGAGYVHAEILSAPRAAGHSILILISHGIFAMARSGLPEGKQQEREEIEANPETLEIHDSPLLSFKDLFGGYASRVCLSNLGLCQ